MAPLELKRSSFQNAILGAVILKDHPGYDQQNPLGELRALARTAGAKIVGEVIQNRNSPNSALFFGKGKAKEIAELAVQNHADLFICDDDLSPGQVRNLEEEIKIQVVDRSGLILDIFALHARSNEARVQVKLAQLKYLLPRLAGRWSHLERQEGAIGTRGPGETQLETDRRIIQKQIIELGRKLREIDKERETQRKGRNKLFRVTLIGYTNAGKSTILNNLTDAGVLVEDKLFATLDSTTRRLNLGRGGIALLTDTVGFISKLPAHLVASFRSTLMDIKDADLLLHICDVSDPMLDAKITTVNIELARLGNEEGRKLLVLNKTDLLQDRKDLEALAIRLPNSIFASAINADGTDELLDKIREESRQQGIEVVVQIGKTDYSLYAEIAKNCRIIDSSSDGEKLIIRLSGRKDMISKLMQKNPQVTFATVVR